MFTFNILSKAKKILSIGIINTIRFNLKYFGLEGLMKCYALVSRKTVLMELGGAVKIEKPHTACIQIGFYMIGISDYKYQRTIWQNSGVIQTASGMTLGSGTRISNTGKIKIGSAFLITGNSILICTDSIIFGDDILISWDVYISDTDMHFIKSVDNGQVLNPPKKIIFGNHIWICCRSIILKGTIIADSTVIAAGSIITGVFEKKFTVIGSEHKILKENVNWSQS